MVCDVAGGGLQVGVGEGGKYKLILDSDAVHPGGQGRVPWDPEMFSKPEGIPGQPDTNYNNRPHSIIVQSPSRTLVVYANMDQKELWDRATKDRIAPQPAPQQVTPRSTTVRNGAAPGIYQRGGEQPQTFFPNGEKRRFF